MCSHHSRRTIKKKSLDTPLKMSPEIMFYINFLYNETMKNIEDGIEKPAGMNEVRQSIESVIENAENVVINESSVQTFVDSILPEELENSDLKGEGALPKEAGVEDCIAYAVINGALQFYFWGEPKWRIKIGDKEYDGGVALIQSIKHGVAEGYPLFDPKYLASIKRDDLNQILKGEPEIPLLGERVLILQEIGKTICEKYEGKFSNFVEKSNGDVCNLVRMLVNDMPNSFDDTALYEGEKVHFYKRAQIIAKYLEDLSQQGRIPQKLFNRKGLTGLADYKAPQILRNLGILKYSESLANKIDNKIEILSGSKEEVEIRASTIKAEDLVAETLNKRFPGSNAALAHRILWYRSQKASNAKPYHHTKTIWY